MSWDVMVFDFGPSPKPMSEMIEGVDHPLPLGTADEVRAKISEHLPSVDWFDPDWGVCVGDGFSLEFSMRDEPQKLGFMIHVRGGGDPIADLLRFSVPNRWSLLDCSTGEWIDPTKPSHAGWQG